MDMGSPIEFILRQLTKVHYSLSPKSVFFLCMQYGGRSFFLPRLLFYQKIEFSAVNSYHQRKLSQMELYSGLDIIGTKIISKNQFDFDKLRNDSYV